MRGAVELVGFLALSAALHTAMALQLPQGGGGGQGAQGQDMATLQASPESLAALIETWQAAPDVAVPVALPMPQVPDHAVPRPTRDMPLEIETPSYPAMPMPDDAATPSTATMPAPARIEAMSVPITQNLPIPSEATPDVSPRATEAIARPDRPALPQPQIGARPSLDTTPAEPTTRDLAIATSPRPQTRPETALQRLPPPAPSAPAPARQAAGTGGGAIAGANPRPAQQPSLSAGERQSLMASWGAQIQRQIERARPRVRATGRAILRLTITRTGQLSAVGIAQSSGNAAVDQAAVQAVQRAGRFPAAPDGLSDASYGFSLPVTFR